MDNHVVISHVVTKLDCTFTIHSIVFFFVFFFNKSYGP